MKRHWNHTPSIKAYLNEGCPSLENFCINDELTGQDLIRLADLNGCPLEVEEGWYPLIIELLKELEEQGWNREVSGIKQKYGELRFYTQEAYDDIVEKYTQRSRTTCESCGKKGRLRTQTNWMHVACGPCHWDTRPAPWFAKAPGACPICGFYAVVDNYCECCENKQWISEKENDAMTKAEYIARCRKQWEAEEVEDLAVKWYKKAGDPAPFSRTLSKWILKIFRKTN